MARQGCCRSAITHSLKQASNVTRVAMKLKSHLAVGQHCLAVGGGADSGVGHNRLQQQARSKVRSTEAAGRAGRQ